MASTSKSIKTTLYRLVEKLQTVCPYADALYTERRTQTITRDSSGPETFSSADAGVKIRAFDGQKFQEICVHGWQPKVLTQEVQRLLKKLEHPIPRKINLKVERTKADKDFVATQQKDPRTVPFKEKMKQIAELHASCLRKEFADCQVTYNQDVERKVFVNQYKQLSSVWSGCALTIIPVVKTADGGSRSDFYRKFSTGFEVMDVNREELDAFLERAAHIKTARKIKPGSYTAVLHPSVAGLLAHESFGHGMEADTVLHGRAKAEEFFGKKIASVKVNICEDASIPSTHGFLFFDDEGTIPKKTYLVEKGVVHEPITNLLSASILKTKRSANGRAESYDRKIYARMTNTFFDRGKDNVKKMIKSVKNGIYIHSGTAGMEDPKGWGVQITGLLCEKIKNGKLTGELYYEATLGGTIPEILKNIKAVGNDFLIADDAGYCAKDSKEWVRVASGGPHLLIEKVELS